MRTTTSKSGRGQRKRTSIRIRAPAPSHPATRRFDLNWFASGPRIRKEPKGVVLIIAPFNFPILLLLGHLVRPRVG